MGRKAQTIFKPFEYVLDEIMFLAFILTSTLYKLLKNCLLMMCIILFNFVTDSLSEDQQWETLLHLSSFLGHRSNRSRVSLNLKNMGIETILYSSIQAVSKGWRGEAAFRCRQVATLYVVNCTAIRPWGIPGTWHTRHYWPFQSTISK